MTDDQKAAPGVASGGVSRRPVMRLPDGLIDQIAAGEVVERPSSVVKELIENAVDADAERLRIEIREGGAALVAVSDDGCGMPPADARLALERHATSKLASVDDLGRLTSFGFRGEALPAIASVSRLRLRTRARGASEGFEIQIDHGRLVDARTAGGPEGTRIEVADLFSGIPARRKFLKTAATEWGHIADWLSRAALALPAIHFDVRRDDKPALHWPAVTDPLDRIAAVLSEREAEALQPLASEQGALRLHGFVSRPDAHRSTAAGIYLFVNGRPVRDRLLRHALLEVYRDWLPRGRFPTALLFLELPAEAVDVNVHPAKWEVRFAEPQSIHRLIRHGVRDAMAARGWLSGQDGTGAPASSTLAGTTEAADPGPVGAPPTPREPGGFAAGRAQAGPASQTSDWLFARGARDGADPVADAPTAAAEEALRFADLRPLGQLLQTYLLLEGKEGLLLVDQHAAHERVLYERLRAAWLAGGVERQGLLLATTVELEPAAAARLAEQQETALRLGFELDAFGESALVVRAVPALLSDRDPAALVRGLADELLAGSGALPDAAATRLLPLADRIIATLACHSARRAGDILEPREQRALLDSLDAIPWAPTCPHGRPVAVRLSLTEIERRFGR